LKERGESKVWWKKPKGKGQIAVTKKKNMSEGGDWPNKGFKNFRKEKKSIVTAGKKKRLMGGEHQRKWWSRSEEMTTGGVKGTVRLAIKGGGRGK